MVQAIIWEVLQWRASLTIAESGKIMGGEMHKSKIAEKIGEEGIKGAMRRPKLHFSEQNLFITLLSKTIGGKR